MSQKCCGLIHSFDRCAVAEVWVPAAIRCFIIGENPGIPGAPYFYDPIPLKRDSVGVRRLLLPALAAENLISEPTLLGFREGGFLFDHAIRCQLPKATMDRERARARTFRPSLADQASHLRRLVGRSCKVWLMGGVARAAIRSQYPELGVEARNLEQPYAVESKFFVSHYLRPRFDTPDDVALITTAVRGFLA